MDEGFINAGEVSVYNKIIRNTKAEQTLECGFCFKNLFFFVTNTNKIRSPSFEYSISTFFGAFIQKTRDASLHLSHPLIQKELHLDQ